MSGIGAELTYDSEVWQNFENFVKVPSETPWKSINYNFSDNLCNNSYNLGAYGFSD